MTEQQKQELFAKYVDLEGLLQEYRKALMWLMYGDHNAVPHPSEKDTRKILKMLQEQIVEHMIEMETETQL